MDQLSWKRCFHIMTSKCQHSMLLDLCEGNPLVTDGFPLQRASAITSQWFLSGPCGWGARRRGRRARSYWRDLQGPHRSRWNLLLLHHGEVAWILYCLAETKIRHEKETGWLSIRCLQLCIKAWTKWTIFCRRHLQICFCKRKCLYFELNFIEMCSFLSCASWARYVCMS